MVPREDGNEGNRFLNSERHEDRAGLGHAAEVRTSFDVQNFRRL